MKDQYRELAEDYLWIRSPELLLSGERFLHRYSELLEQAGKRSRVLDCSCGNGSDAIALATAGFRVWASDGSKTMVTKARERAHEAGVSVPIEQVAWELLPTAYKDPFDVVFCVGNSIVHAGGEKPMIAALAGMKAVMKDGATLVVDSRNWDKHLRVRPDNHALAPVQMGATRCFPIYLWDYGDAFEGPHSVTIVLVLERRGEVEVRRHSLSYTAFSRNDLIRRLEAGGFRNVEADWTPDASWYSVMARRP